MKHYARYPIAIAICLSALAGYIDAIGFLELGGFFISFMSGNSTRLAVGLAQQNEATIIMIGSLIFSFVLGVAAGTALGRKSGRQHQPSTVLALVTSVLCAALIGHTTGHSWFAVLAMAFAMGAENTVFQRDGEIAFGLTYMTGTLVKLGQRIAHAFFGEPVLAGLPYLLLWLGLLCGGVSGVLLYQAYGLQCLWLAVLCAAILTLTVNRKPLH